MSMEQKSPRKPKRLVGQLGCQLWVEPDQSVHELRRLMRAAKESGLSRLRIFLLWTRIEREPGTMDFRIYDRVFDLAAREGLGIKATLTANSGPWHIGTPAALHSHTGFLADSQREPMQAYIGSCVSRYAGHPALEQWMLWNEPHGGFLDHTPDNLPGWQATLRRMYGSDIGVLNRRWLTGFAAFDEIPWPEELAHPAHRSGSWTPYRPRLDEMEWRAKRVVEQVAWVAQEVRRHDPVTELCINPIFTIENQAGGATDLRALARTVDRIGSSYHPVFWHSKLRREDYPGLIAAGVATLAQSIPGKPVELTEVVSGNCVSTGSRPGSVSGPEIARFYLAALAAGAETVTGWCLNARTRDGEAAEFALLDDNDEVSERSRYLARLADTLERVRQQSGSWKAALPDFLLATSRRSQAIDLLDSEGCTRPEVFPGRGPQDSARGVWMLAQRAMELCYAASPVVMESLGIPKRHQVLIVSQMIAWEATEAQAILRWAQRGGTLVIDAGSGRKDFDSARHAPWPGVVWKEIDLVVRDSETLAEPIGLRIDGATCGHAFGVRAQIRCGPAWEPSGEIRFDDDSTSVFLERSFGRGRIVFSRMTLGSTLLKEPDSDVWLKSFFRTLAPVTCSPLRTLNPRRGWVTLPVDCQAGELVVVLTPVFKPGASSEVRLATAPGFRWQEFWSGGEFAADSLGEFEAALTDGIGIFWRPHPQP